MLIQIDAGQPVAAPIDEIQFKSRFKNVSFTSILQSEDVLSRGYAFYQNAVAPQPGRYEVIEKSTPVQVSDDLWETGWTTRQMTADEITAADADKALKQRGERNARLTKSDWTQFNDSPLSDSGKYEWAQYRTALRNVPTQTGFPWEIVWPKQPV